MSERLIQDTYLEMLKAYASKPDEECLAKFEAMGPLLVTEGVTPEEIAQIHDESSRRLCEESPNQISPDTFTQIFPALPRVLKAYGVAFQQHIEQDLEKCQKHAERKFRKIFDQSGDGIVMVDTAGTILDVNRKALNLWGYVRAEMLELKHVDLYAPQATESSMSLFQILFEAQTQQPDSHHLTLDVACKRKDGSLFYGEFSGSGMDFEGRSCFVGVVRDITLRKQALEERVRLQEELADEISVTLGIVDTAADGIITIDEQGRIESYNKAARRMFGFEEFEVLGKPVSLVLPSPNREEHSEDLEPFKATGEASIRGKTQEVLGQRNDGSTFSLELAVSEVQLGDRKVFTGIVRDITQRKQIENNLRVLNRAMAASPLGLVITDPQQLDNPIVYANPAFFEMTGYTSEEVIGHNCRFLQGVEGEQSGLDDLRDAIAQERDCQVILRNNKKDGSLFWNSLTLSPVFDEDGQLVSFLGIQEDITRRMQDEEEREQLNFQLRKTSRQAGMADVASGILHNVGNILTSVSVSAGLIRKLVQDSKISKLQRTAALLDEHRRDLGEYLHHDPKGQKIPEYLTQLGAHLAEEQVVLIKEAKELTTNIEHINQVIQMQQILAKPSGGHEELVALHDLMEQALYINVASLHRQQVEIVREYGEAPHMLVDQH